MARALRLPFWYSHYCLRAGISDNALESLAIIQFVAKQHVGYSFGENVKRYSPCLLEGIVFFLKALEDNGREVLRRGGRMGEKDIAEKALAEHNDVFADILNGFLFHGEQVVLPGELEDAGDRSQYKADGRLHELERDVSKRLRDGKVTLAMVGLEHQSKAERFMPVRVGSYDFQSYRAQLSGRNVGSVYPVATMVLYFGMKRWPYPRNLTGIIDMPERLRPFVSDYEMKNLFQVAFLEPEQVKWFRSDFRYVADYFVQKRLTGDYHPSTETIGHVDATLKLMSVLTDDTRFEEVITDLSERKGGVNMCDVLDRVENRGIEKGVKQGYNKAQRETAARMLALGKFSKEDIAAALGITVDAVDQIEQQEMMLT